MAVNKTSNDICDLPQEDRDGEELPQEEWDALLAAELQRRLDNLAAGRTKLHTHEEVMARIQARLR